MTYDYRKLRVDEAEPGIVRVLINRPDKRNAMDVDVRAELIDVFGRFQGDVGVRAVLLGGVDGNFSAGGDLPSMVNLTEADARNRMQHIARLCRLVHATRVPVVTAMEGVSAGACVGLALLGDWIVAGVGTQVLLPFMKLGLVPDWGMLHTLPLRTGIAAARRLFTAKSSITANDALQIGLIDELVANVDVMPAALSQARHLANLPGLAFARMKARLNHRSSTLDDDLDQEESDQAFLLQSADFREGHAAFMEKRVPNFSLSSVKE